MVVHDMRNPTSSIEFGLKETLKILDTHFENYNNLKKTFMQWKAQEELEQNLLDSEEAQSENSSDDQIVEINGPGENNQIQENLP